MQPTGLTTGSNHSSKYNQTSIQVPFSFPAAIVDGASACRETVLCFLTWKWTSNLSDRLACLQKQLSLSRSLLVTPPTSSPDHVLVVITRGATLSKQ
jgi:hypothetical protein